MFGAGVDPTEALTYYGIKSGAGYALANHPRAGQGLRVGLIGLGAGTLAYYARKGDHYTFFEIDPDVERIAERRFTYMRDARKRGATVETILGDGRMQLARRLAAGGEPFDLLVIDAFSSDAIPVHLLTKECNDLYWKSMTEDGLLLVHISNRHLNLAPVLRGLADDAQTQIRLMLASLPDISGTLRARWAILTNNVEFLAQKPMQLTGSTAHKKSLLWTDDFSSLWHVLN